MGVLESFRLDGKVSLITGAGSGFGEAWAEAVAEAGSNVACVDINTANAERVAQKIRDLGCKAIAITADVSKDEQVKEAVERTVKELGGLQIAFANAGIAGENAPLFESQTKLWEETISINLTSVYLTIREAAKAMKPQKYGKIIATASIYSFVGDMMLSEIPYAAAKGGVANLVRMSAVQLAPLGIRVNAIAPAFFKTNIADGILLSKDPDAVAIQDALIARTPLGRLGEPEEIKGLGLFLASPASDYCTGSIVPIDGGWLSI